MTERQLNPRKDARLFRQSLLFTLLFVSLLWSIKLTEIFLGFSLAQYGIYPGKNSGLMGILWAPLIHGSIPHLISNTLPTVILGTALLYGYPKSTKIVLPLVYIGSGIGVWLFARSAYHIGASNLTFGTMFFIFTIGALRWDKLAIALSSMVFFLYGSMIWGIFPREPDISYESHFFSAIIGVVLAFLLRNYDSAQPEKKYSWEGEPEDVDGDDIRDQDWNTKG